MLRDILNWHLAPRTGRMPLYLIVFVTYRCNSRCRTCFYHEHLNNADSADLPLTFYEALARSCGHLAWLHLSGGEPFMRQDIPELVAAFYRHAGVRRIGIPTNGLDSAGIEEKSRRILELCPDSRLNIVLSLDGLQDTHDYLRGVPGNWEKTIETIAMLKRLKAEKPQISLNICTVLNNRNVSEIPELFHFVRELGVDFHDIGLMRGDFPDRNLILPLPEKVAEILKVTEEYARRYYEESPAYPGMAAHRAARAHRYINKTFLSFLRTGNKSQPCFAGDGFAVIEPNGEVRLCELTPTIGNLLETGGDFEAFWNKETTRRARRTGKCREEACTHSNFQTRNFLLNPWQWWRVLP
ncbi:MAG: radical SAM protein [Desulfuromonadaceae bacterium]|nr:radical SAM protein [Desulfuromonadaceae bacterium]MDD5104094.1 radical SAM protein [Desulfuromonadaceae bacterium]